MIRNAVLGAGLAAAMLLPSAAWSQDERTSVRIGYAVSKSGPNAGGTAASTIPNYQLWVDEVNKRGGLKLGERTVPIEIVEYDDRSTSEEAVRAVERLITQDEVDLVLPPWGTSMNLAVAPILHQNGYPHLAVAAVTDRATELSQRWPNLFFYEGTSTSIATSAFDVFNDLREQGAIGNKIAMVGIADSFGIELATAARKAAAELDFELVYDKSYPPSTQDFNLILGELKELQPDVFLAFSYPPDTITMTEQAKILSFNPPVFFTSIGTAFPLYLEKYGENAEGVMGVGGVDGNSELFKDYVARHKEFTGFEPDRFTSPLTYASLEILEQAIENVGEIDHEQIIEEMRSGTFDTILGSVQFKDNMLQNVFQIGQWQDGEFRGVAPAELAGASKPVAPKPDWTN